MSVLEVFADVACPFTHVGLRRFVALRSELHRSQPLCRVRAWPLELVNGAALAGATLKPKIAALQESVAPGLFAGFHADCFPTTSWPALVAEAAAHRTSPEIGEAFSLGVRTALFEEGKDISDGDVLEQLRQRFGAPAPNGDDEEQVTRDYEDGKARGVTGSPHFFAPDGTGFFCPTLDIEHHDGGLQVRFDEDGFAKFARTVFG